MNYSSYATFDELLKDVLEGVHKEWLYNADREETDFLEALQHELRFVYNISKKKEKVTTKRFCPNPRDLLEPFRRHKPSEVKVLICGQDPYPKLEDTTGIAFHSYSSPPPNSAVHICDSLRKYGHIEKDSESFSDFSSWMKQGVMMINRSMTCIEGSAASHGMIWDDTTKSASRLIPVASVTLMLGNDAGSLKDSVASKVRIYARHPSYLDGGFLDKDVFGEVNAALKKLSLTVIDWHE